MRQVQERKEVQAAERGWRNERAVRSEEQLCGELARMPHSGGRGRELLPSAQVPGVSHWDCEPGEHSYITSYSSRHESQLSPNNSWCSLIFSISPGTKMSLSLSLSLSLSSCPIL